MQKQGNHLRDWVKDTGSVVGGEKPEGGLREMSLFSQ